MDRKPARCLVADASVPPWAVMADAVATGGHPDTRHQVWMEASEHDRFLKQVQTV